MAKYGYETPDGKKVSAFIDSINGGGAGRSGDTFEGGGILSVLANLLASPYGSKRNRGSGQGEQLRLPGGPAPENALTLDQFAMQNVRPQARPTGASAADLMAGDQAAYDAAFGKAPGLTDGEVLQQGIDQVVADPALMALLGITEGPKGMPSPIAPDMGPEIFVPGSDAAVPRPTKDGRYLEMSAGDYPVPQQPPAQAGVDVEQNLTGPNPPSGDVLGYGRPPVSDQAPSAVMPGGMSAPSRDVFPRTGEGRATRIGGETYELQPGGIVQNVYGQRMFGDERQVVLDRLVGDKGVPPQEGRATMIGGKTYVLMPNGIVYNADTDSVVTDFDTQAAVMRKLMADMGQ